MILLILAFSTTKNSVLWRKERKKSERQTLTGKLICYVNISAVFGFSFKTEKGENERELEGSILFSCSPVISSWTATSIKLHGSFGLALRRGCSAVDLVVFFGARFYDSTSGGLLLQTEYSLYIYIFPSTHLTHYMSVFKH